ncbi:hypothetical protein ASD08_42540 [Streptomyces sp. Root369]|nr:hypothetical protein ASD08_42540 [Streptomyces sp. Root369]
MAYPCSEWHGFGRLLEFRVHFLDTSGAPAAGDHFLRELGSHREQVAHHVVAGHALDLVQDEAVFARSRVWSTSDMARSTGRRRQRYAG